MAVTGKICRRPGLETESNNDFYLSVPVRPTSPAERSFSTGAISPAEPWDNDLYNGQTDSTMPPPPPQPSPPTVAAGEDVEILLNGDRRLIRDGSTVRDLLDELNLGVERVAVEVDRMIVRRAEWSERELTAGAAVEIVHFVGGG